jgi:NAD(P)-dependent dehydrogenase (short-subunit alcohol dehydrogenase family)
MTATEPIDRMSETPRVVLIAGATGGIGPAVTRRFVDEGANVVLTSRRHDRLEDLAATMGIPDTQCLLREAELTDSSQARELVTAIIGCFSRLDVVISLVGSYAKGRIASTTDEIWLGQLQTNLYSTFYLLREAVPHVTDGGAIITTGNALPTAGRGGQLAYAVAKAGVHTLTESLALELKPRGIRVNAILPRDVDTPGNRALQPEADPSNWPNPDEVARVVYWLASSDARLVSGALVPV